MMRLIGLVLLLFFCTTIQAQENSPYSRYGIGDLTPNHNILSRSMGGIAAGYSDFQTVNFINPASYGNISYIRDPKYLRTTTRNTIFDIGVEADTKTLKSINPAAKFSATNLVISYVQLGLPIKLKKANRKGFFLGANFGLKPVSKINYKILNLSRPPGTDSLARLYEGSGGLNEANIGLGIRYRNFNLGFNGGYKFGSKDFSTKLSFINDTVAYYQSISSSKTTFGGLFFNAGVQYELNLKNTARLRFGAYGNLKQQLSADQNEVKQTITVDGSGTSFRLDSVFEKSSTGKVELPASFGIGFTYQDSANHWTLGVDYERTFWNKYRYFGVKDQVQDNWKIRVGAEYFPASLSTPIKKYFNFVRYRAGFYYGPDYINIGTTLPEYAVTFGAGFPLRLRKGYYETQVSYLNTSFEIGSRGNKNANLREGFFRISLGFSLSDLWFNRSKYY